MPDDADDFGFDDEGGGESGSGESAESGGGLKRFFSGAILRVLLFVAAGIAVIIISVITASIVAGGSGDSGGGEIRDIHGLTQKPPAYAGFDLDEFMVGTADRDSTHFVRLKLSLAYEPGNMLLQSELSERRRQIYDLIILTLNKKTWEDLHSSTQKEQFKDELIKLINGRLQNGEIKDIYYSDFFLN